MSYPNINTPSQSISCSTSSASITLTSANARGSFVTIYNSGSVPIFVRSGEGSATAVTTDYPIPAASRVTLAKSPAHNVIAAITASSTATAYVTIGGSE
jgi:hypothetical protein